MTSNTVEQEFVSFMHPWCKRLFVVEKRFLKIEGNAKMCCMRCVEKEPSKCKIAIENWKE